MKRYEFRAVRTGKQEAIIGFAYAAILMFPILAIRLGLFYSGLDKTLKSKPFIWQFGFLFVVIAAVYASFYFIRKTQESLVKSYTVELDAGNITIWENGEELVTGSVVDCEIINKMKSKPTAGLSITLYTDTDKITFRLREKSGKGSQPNGQIPILSEQVIHRIWRRNWLFLEILMILLANRQTQIMMCNNLAFIQEEL